jgi:hypothetical protein
VKCSVDTLDVRDPLLGMEAAVRRAGDKKVLLDAMDAYISSKTMTENQKKTAQTKFRRTIAGKSNEHRIFVFSSVDNLLIE